MNPKVAVNARFHNKFEFELIDSITGHTKQKAFATNVVLDRLWTLLGTNNNYDPMGFCALGTGSGTPAPSDTGLFSYSTSAAFSTNIETVRQYPTSHRTRSATFPATSSYVGTYTEVGIAYNGQSNSYVLTHAMLTDAEGNPTTIEKTELDILIVTATLYVTVTNNTDTFYLTPLNNNQLLNFMLLDGKPSTASKNPLLPSTQVGGARLALLPCSIPLNDSIINSRSAGTLLGLNNSASSWNASTKTLTVVANRLGTGSGNTRYYHGLALEGQGHIQFPNAAVFPNYEITGAPVGTGDGVTTAFKVPIPLFVQNTDKVYKNGTQLVRGTDYTIEHNSNPDMLCCISPGNFSTFDAYSGTLEVAALNAYTPTATQPFVCDALAVLLDYHATLDAAYLAARNIFAMSPDSPGIFTLMWVDQAITKKCNFLKLGYLSTGRSVSTLGDPRTVTFVLSCSNDKVAWMQVASLTPTVATPDADFGIMRFDAVEATYWKLEITPHSSSSYYARYATILGSPNAMALGYTNPTGLVFTTAPADGDILTMDCTIDRPYKNENFVIDTSMTVQFA